MRLHLGDVLILRPHRDRGLIFEARIGRVELDVVAALHRRNRWGIRSPFWSELRVR